MDKYEYKLKTEQMLELMGDGAYNKAAEIADTIDWKKVRNTTMLSTVSEIYEKNGDYQKSYDVLRIAAGRAEGSRKIITHLCTLALKTRNVDEAIDYYDDFIEIAPKDPNQYILKYQILRAQRAPVEQQIHALEEFKKSEYIEEWAYELAKLYQEAGMTAECLEECDDLILWFSEGKYVYQAMELKMRHKPLTPSQQEKYNRRYEKHSTETEEIPDLTEYHKKEEPSAEQTEEAQADAQEAVQEVTPDDKQEDKPEERVEETEKAPQPVKKKIGNTMKLDEALKSLLNITLKDEKAGAETEAVEETVEEAEEDLTELESKIEEIEAVADLGFVDKIAAVKQREIVKVDPDLEELRPQPGEDEDDIEEAGEAGSEESDEDAVEAKEATVEKTKEDRAEDDGQIQGQLNFMDILENWGAPDEENAEAEDVELENMEGFTEGDAEEYVEDFAEDDAEEYVEDFAEDDAEEYVEDIKVETEEGETMEDKKKETPILSPDIQRLIDEIEGNIPSQEEETFVSADDLAEAQEAEALEDMGAVADGLRVQEESDEFEDYDEILDEDEYEEEEAFTWGAEDAVDAVEAEGFSGVYGSAGESLDDYSIEEAEEYNEEFSDEYEEEYDEELSDEYEEDYEDELFEEEEYDEELFDEYEEDYDDESSIAEGFEEEFRRKDDFDEIDDREIPDDDDGMDILSATTPLSRKETAKLHATGKTAPLPLDEISSALSLSDTGFVVHGRYDLKTQSGVGTRAGLTEEQKKLFSYFVPVRGMSEQLVDVLEQDKNCTNRRGTSCTGNLLIIGNKGNGKTVLAVDVVKAIQKQRNIRQGKVAIVTGDSLNKKKISDIVSKLYGGALIIEKAGKMNEKTVARLNKAMEQDTGELLIVLEDQRKPLDRLLSSNREFRRKFTSRLEVPVFINDELVTFGQTYAQENGYRIDEMSILALYSRIDSLQREDHAVTIAEVKEIMDEAMEHSKKASAKKLVKRVFGKNTDEADRIILTEKDFNI